MENQCVATASRRSPGSWPCPTGARCPRRDWNPEKRIELSTKKTELTTLFRAMFRNSSRFVLSLFLVFCSLCDKVVSWFCSHINDVWNLFLSFPFKYKWRHTSPFLCLLQKQMTSSVSILPFFFKYKWHHTSFFYLSSPNTNDVTSIVLLQIKISFGIIKIQVTSQVCFSLSSLNSNDIISSFLHFFFKYKWRHTPLFLFSQLTTSTAVSMTLRTRCGRMTCPTSTAPSSTKEVVGEEEQHSYSG